MPLTSLHSVKGLAFDLVFLLPQEASGGSEDEDALRRLCVGVTRAKHRLVIPYVGSLSMLERLEAAGARR